MASCIPLPGRTQLSLLQVLLLLILPRQHDGYKQTRMKMRNPMTTLDCCQDPKSVEENFVAIASPSDANGSITGFVGRHEIMLHVQSYISFMDLYPENQTKVVVNADSFLPHCNITTCMEPSPVTGLLVGNRTNSSVILLWQTLADCCHMASATEPRDSWRNGTTHISGLFPGQDYVMTMYRTLEGRSSQGTAINVSTMPSPVLNVTIENRTVGELVIGWIAPEDPHVATYIYRVCLLNYTVISQSLQAIVSNLEAGVMYKVAIYAFTRNNVSSTGMVINATTVPNSPRKVHVANYSSDTISISWEPPDDHNAALYLYRVSWFLESEEPQGSRTTHGSSCIIDGLQPGYLYLVKLSSDIHGVKSTETTEWILTAPLPATNFKIQNINQTEAEFTWEPPNSTFSGYKLQWKNSTESNENEISLGNSSMEAVLGLLTPSTNYTFTLLSLMQRRNLMTHSSGVQLKGATKPERIKDMQCWALAGGHDLKLSWTCPTHEVSKFQVVVSDQVQKMWLKQCKESIVIDQLRPARTYWIQVETFWHDQSAISDPVECFTDNTGVIMGPLVALLLFLILLGLLLFYLYFRRWRRKPNRVSKKQKSDVESPGALPSVSVSNFPCYCCERFSSNALGFAMEFQQLRYVGTQQSQSMAERPENQAKNRYSNVLPYDHSRVQLTPKPGDPYSDYINASYMPGFQREKEFIAAQGPLPGTLHDFWRMIWEQWITTLVMLTNCSESGRVKCERYWPLDYTPCTYGDITVSVVNEIILPDWTIRDFSIKRLNESEVRLARHYHYTSWPDHGVPLVTSAILQFRELVRQHIERHEGSGPALIHCSAGVGRTGTFIALDSLLRQAQDKGEIGVFSFVQRLRMNRPLMIQTESQYIFLHECLLDGIEVAMQNSNEKMEYTTVYENVLVPQEYEVSRV